METNTNKLPAEVRYFQVFADASGAPALIDVIAKGQRFTFACDLLGEQTLRLVAPMTGSAAASKIAADKARAIYARALAQLPESYLAANRAMYATVGA